MPCQRDRRTDERVSCKLVVSFQLTKQKEGPTVEFLAGRGHVINRSAVGMLLLLPEQVDTHALLEIHMSPCETNSSAKVMEVCWTRVIPVNDRDAMCLAGARFVFELPAPP